MNKQIQLMDQNMKFLVQAEEKYLQREDKYEEETCAKLTTDDLEDKLKCTKEKHLCIKQRWLLLSTLDISSESC
uniref:Uncharacterized protein n=1 Tax=Salvator merianae TaxID=96440 RepID=A0A8D0BE35_SALMN